MMYNYPFFNFPFFTKYPAHSRYYAYQSPSNMQKRVSPYLKEKNQKEINHFSESKPSEEILFEILGLKLYYDDILLICLIFFLYQEGVKDEYLLISLVLLLLS